MQGMGNIFTQHDQFSGDSGPIKDAESIYNMFLSYNPVVESVGAKGGVWGYEMESYGWEKCRE